jgi:hypothetical protein
VWVLLLPYLHTEPAVIGAGPLSKHANVLPVILLFCHAAHDAKKKKLFFLDFQLLLSVLEDLRLVT